MKSAKHWALIGLMGVLLAGCGPSITVENKTSFDIKVLVANNGRREVLSPSPGNSSSMDATEGTYIVTAVRSEEWLNYAKATRQYLNSQLANMDSLSGAQLLEVIQRLKDISRKMAEYENAKSGAFCSGSVTEERSAVATVSLGAGGALIAACRLTNPSR